MNRKGLIRLENTARLVDEIVADYGMGHDEAVDWASGLIVDRLMSYDEAKTVIREYFEAVMVSA